MRDEAAYTGQGEQPRWCDQRLGRVILEAAPFGVVFLDGAGRILDANPAACALFGRDRAELAARGLEELASDAESLAPLARAWGEAPSDAAHPSTQVRCRRPDGAEAIVSIEVHPLADGHALAFLCDVTAEQEVAESLRESEVRFRALAEEAAIGIALVQRNDVVYANSTFAGIVGLTPAEVECWTTEDYARRVHPDDLARVEAEVSVPRPGETARYRHRLVLDDGTIREVEVRHRPFHAEGVRADVVVLQDVTERARAEEALRWRTALDTLRLAAYHLAGYHDLQELRPVMYRVLETAGIPAEACSVQVIDERRNLLVQYYGLDADPAEMRPLDSVAWLPGSAVWEAWRTGRTVYRQLRRERGGQPRYTESPGDRMVSVMDVPFAAGTIGIASSQPDAFTEEHIRKAEELASVLDEPFLRLEAMQRISELESRYRAIFEGVRDPILVLDGGAVRDGNLAACIALGASLESLAGRPLDALFAPPREPGLTPAAELVRLARDGAAMHFEWTIRRTDGTEFPAEVSLAPVEIDQRRMVLSVLRDIAERKRAETERARLEQQVQQAQKLESLGVLAGGIAHDFNNLLMGVLGNASLALSRLAPESSVRGCLEAIETAATRAADLSKQMLAYSGRGRFVVKETDLSALVSEMADLLEASVSKKAALVYELEPGLRPIEADRAQMSQVLVNLVTNASEALGDQSGTVRVGTGQVHADAAYLRGAYLDEDLPEGDYVYLEVADTGCGMDAETRQRIFEPFFTTKFTGRGLGLPAVLGIVRGHGGSIKVYSEPGQGTVVRVLLPTMVAAAEEEIEPPPARGLTAWHTEGLVLVADDEPVVRQVTQLALEMAGLRVLAASDGQEAVERFEEHADEIRAVILDVTMPRLSGDEVFHVIRRMRPEVPVILSSGFGEQEATARLVGRGLAGFLQKPYVPSELLALLERILEGGRS